MNTSLRVAFLLLCSFLMPSTIASAQPAVDAEAKPFIGTWSGKENRQLGLPAPKLKIRKDGKGAYFLTSPDKPLYEFEWEMGEDQLQRKSRTARGFSQLFSARTESWSGGKPSYHRARRPTASSLRKCRLTSSCFSVPRWGGGPSQVVGRARLPYSQCYAALLFPFAPPHRQYRPFNGAPCLLHD